MEEGGHEKGLMGNSFSPVWFELLSQFKQCRGSKHRPAQMQTNFLSWVLLN